MRKVEQRPLGHRLVINWNERMTMLIYMHKHGGTPSNGAILPPCGGCGERLHLLLQIDLADPQIDYLSLSDLNYLYVLTCLNCASYEKPMYYRIAERGYEIVILQEKPSACVHEYPDPLEEYPVFLRPLEDNEYPLTESDLFRLLKQEGKHQLGGMPIWVQREECIPCIVCGGAMEYIAMIDSELYIGKDGFRERGHMFGDEGILYMFVCRECSVFATKAQGV
jgi:hypothetical protein